MGRNATAWEANFGAGWSEFWKNAGWSSLHPVQVGIGGPMVLVNLLVILAVVQVGSLFSADAWNNITFTAGEVKNPKRNIPLSLILGTGFVLTVYFLVSLGYLLVLPMHGDPNGATVMARGIQYATEDRVATAALEQIFHSGGAYLMAAAILISTFGCANGMSLAGARVYYAMSQDGLFFKSVGKLHPRYKTPAAGLLVQAAWTIVLCVSGSYSQLLDYIIFAVLVFYILTIVGLFVLRFKRPDAPRPYKALGYPGAARALYRAGRLDLYRIIAVQAAVHVAGSGAGSAGHSRLSLLVAKRCRQNPRRTRSNLKPTICGGSPSFMSRLLRIKPMSMLSKEAGEQGEHTLKRSLGALNLVTLGIGAIIGAGIFVLTGQAAAKHAGPAVALSFVLAGITCAFAGLCYAEFASIIPIAGSAYTYGYATLGEFVAWIIGWDLGLEYGFGAATVASGWCGLLQQPVAAVGHLSSAATDRNAGHGAGLFSRAMAAAGLAAAGSCTDRAAARDGALQSAGDSGDSGHHHRSGDRHQGVGQPEHRDCLCQAERRRHFHCSGRRTSSSAIRRWPRPTGIPSFLLPTGTATSAGTALPPGAASIFFAYIGFDAVSTAAQEAKNPQKDMPIGILGSLVICTILYIVVSTSSPAW